MTVGCKIDYAENGIPESTAYFFFINLNFIMIHFIEIKILEKHFLVMKKFAFEGRFEVSLIKNSEKAQNMANLN